MRLNLVIYAFDLLARVLELPFEATELLLVAPDDFLDLPFQVLADLLILLGYGFAAVFDFSDLVFNCWL